MKAAQHCEQQQIQVVLVKRQHQANMQLHQVEANFEGYFTAYGKAVSRIHQITSSEDLSCLTAQSTDLLLGEQQQ